MVAPQLDVSSFRLDNGLRLVVSEDHVVPVAAVNLWYDVGSKDERLGRTGFAHLFEHMMFQGSTNVAKVEHFTVIQQLGGVVNATTTLHRTNYFQEAPSNAWRLLMWLEADRMGGLLDALDQSTLDNQRDVVKNEKRERYDNAPYGSFMEHRQRALFPEHHPYHHTTVGSMQDLDAAELGDVQEFFQTFYVPNNAVLTVAGDVDTDEVVTYANEAFGHIPAGGEPPHRDPTIEPGGLGTELTLVEDVPLPRIYISSIGPALGTPEADALEVALALLIGNEVMASRSSKLYQVLVRDRQLVQDIAVFMSPFPGASIMTAVMTMRPEADPATARAAFWEVLAQFLHTDPTDEQMERARAGLTRRFLEGMGTTMQRADQLSEAELLLGGGARVNEVLPALLAVDAPRAMDAARTYLRRDNAVTITYLKEPS